MSDHGHDLQDIGTKAQTLNHLLVVHQESGVSDAQGLADLREHHESLHARLHAERLDQERRKLADMAQRDPVWLAFKLLGGQVPPLAGNAASSRPSPIRAIGWDATNKVLSVYRYGGQRWMNLWLEASNNDGEPFAETSNRAAPGTVILWANHESTYRELAAWDGVEPHRQ